MPGIDIEFFSPHEPSLLTLLQNLLKEAEKDLDSIALTNTGQTRMIRQRLSQIIVANVPADAESVCRMSHQETFGADVLKKHDQLQFEEHDGINRRTTTP
jgi:hypothetical protein